MLLLPPSGPPPPVGAPVAGVVAAQGIAGVVVVLLRWRVLYLATAPEAVRKTSAAAPPKTANAVRALFSRMGLVTRTSARANNAKPDARLGLLSLFGDQLPQLHPDPGLSSR